MKSHRTTEVTARRTRFRLPGIPANVQVKELGYLFPRSVLEEAINECAPVARAGLMPAHINHPKVVDREGASLAVCAPGDRAAMVTDCFIDQWGQTWWDYQTMTTPAGLALESNVLDGAPLGTSYLFSSVEFVAPNDKLSVRIVSKLRLLTNDISACPYTPMTIIRPILLSGRGLPLRGAFPFAPVSQRYEPRSLSSRIEELKTELSSFHQRRRRAVTRSAIEFELERLSLLQSEMLSARDALRRSLLMSGDFTKYEVQMAVAADLAQKASAAAAHAREYAEHLCLSLDSISGELGAIPHKPMEGDDSEEYIDDAQRWSESAAD